MNLVSEYGPSHVCQLLHWSGCGWCSGWLSHTLSPSYTLVFLYGEHHTTWPCHEQLSQGVECASFIAASILGHESYSVALHWVRGLDSVQHEGGGACEVWNWSLFLKCISPLWGRDDASRGCQRTHNTVAQCRSWFSWKWDVTHVDYHDSLIYEFLEDVIHHGLEHHRAVWKAEEHDRGQIGLSSSEKPPSTHLHPWSAPFCTHMDI